MKCKLLYVIMAVALFSTSIAQTSVSIFPQPQQITVGQGSFIITAATPILVYEKAFEKEAAFLSQHLQDQFGLRLKTTADPSNKMPAIMLKKADMGQGKPEGTYTLNVTQANITIAANDAVGIFYGIQSLLQLAPQQKGNSPIALAAVNIVDAPRFAYRGMMLDVARHFQDVAYVKQTIDRLARLKFNTFHWHLTEDQGWRIEIKKYPKLTEVGAFRNGTIIGRYPGTGNDNKRYGGFYTQEQIKEVVQYAADRHITIIPEIEMPGHSSAAIAAYPWLSCFPDEETVIHKHPSEVSKGTKGKKVQESWGVYEDVYAPTEQTFQFLQDVIDEVVALFPGKYIHIGGDECPKESWKRSEFCQQLIKEKGLKDEHGLQSYFIQRMEKYINSKGKQIIGWDEILEGGLAPNATVMSWRGEKGGIESAKQRHDVIMSPNSHAYLDHSQTKKEDSVVIGGYLPLQKVYEYDPMPQELRGTEYEKFVKGAQGNVWTEYMRTPAKIEYMIFPRLAALSEAVWTQPNNKNWSNFEGKLPVLYTWLGNNGINYSRAVELVEAKK